MIQVTPEEFETDVAAAVEAIPSRFAVHLENLAFLTADEPSPSQLAAGGRLHGNEVLLGLYEGIPLPQRGDGYTMVLPDVITIFQRAHEQAAENRTHLKQLVHETVWHEVAHYFGLDHGQIHALEH